MYRHGIGSIASHLQKNLSQSLGLPFREFLESPQVAKLLAGLGSFRERFFPSGGNGFVFSGAGVGAGSFLSQGGLPRREASGKT